MLSFGHPCQLHPKGLPEIIPCMHAPSADAPKGAVLRALMAQLHSPHIPVNSQKARYSEKILTLNVKGYTLFSVAHLFPNLLLRIKLTPEYGHLVQDIIHREPPSAEAPVVAHDAN